MLRVHLFGHPRLLLDEIAFPTAGRPKVIPLLAYLLLHKNAAAPRRAVANALWPDSPEDEARANLRRHLNYLQRMLPQAPDDLPWLIVRDRHVQWNPACKVWLDVDEFERFAAQPQRQREAIATYAGDLLPEYDDEWLRNERDRLRAQYHAALSAHVASSRAAHDYQAAIAAAQRLLASDPWREDTLRTVLQLRHACGDRAGALAQYERFAATLRDELGTEPMAETVATYAAILRDEAPFGDVPQPAAGATSRSSSLPFVGRDAELDELRERWDGAVAGRGGLILIGGEAGIGKTRLVRELAARCEAQGALVYAAATTPSETLPYHAAALLLRAAAPLAATLGVDPMWLSAVSSLAPSIVEHGIVPELSHVEPARERRRLFEAYANVWQAMAQRRPVLLVVEDVHWAGEATLALLEYLVRRATESRILVVATYREDELALDHKLRALRRNLERDGACRHVALARLSRSAIDELVAARTHSGAGANVARLLYERSEGNPFFVSELVRALAEAGRLRETDAGWSIEDVAGVELPPALHGVLAERIARLDDAARTLAEFAAVVGRGFDVELLRETIGWAEATVLDALETLLDRRIVSVAGTHGAFDYAFTHHLIQTFVYDGIDEATRVRRHRRVAHVMSALYADRAGDVAGELARHWDRGGDAERAAERYVEAARSALEIYAHDEASRFVHRALELTASPRRRFDALLLRERIASIAGDRDAQARDLADLSVLARELASDDAFCTVLERRVELANLTGDRKRERVLLALLERRIRRTQDTGWRRHALEARARHLRAVNDFAGARSAFEELVALTASSGDRAALVKARLAIADSYIYEGQVDRAAEVLAELRAAVDTAGSRGDLVRTLMAFARAALIRQDYAAMLAFGEEARDVSRAIGDSEGEALALHTIANGLLYTFRVAETGDHYERALAIYERIDHRVGLASISVDLGLFNTELGMYDRALALYDRARTIAAEIGFRWVTCIERIDAAYCLRLRGDFELSHDAAQGALAVARALGSQQLESAALGTLGAAESALGRHVEAIAHLRDAVELRRPGGATPRLGDNLCALALALLRAGAIDEAAEIAAEMLGLYRAHPYLPPQPTEWLWTAAEVERARRNAAAADVLTRQARAVMDARAAAIGDAEIRAAFLALPFNRAVGATAGLRTRC